MCSIEYRTISVSEECGDRNRGGTPIKRCSATAECPTGFRVTGGVYRFVVDDDDFPPIDFLDVSPIESIMFGSFNDWTQYRIRADVELLTPFDGSEKLEINARAVCIGPASAFA